MEENRTESSGNRDPAEIERDIAETRESIDSTVGELGERLAPSQLVDDAKTYVKETAMRGANSLWTRLSENALPLGLIGGGVVWMLASRRSHDDGFGSPYYPKHGDTAPGNVGRLASSLVDQAEGLATRTADQAREVTGQVRERAGEIGSRVQETAHRQVDRVRHSVETLRSEQPLLLGVASLALGALIGGVIPSTRREDELLGETRDQVVGAAADAGLEKAEQMRRSVEETAEKERTDRDRSAGEQGEQSAPMS